MFTNFTTQQYDTHLLIEWSQLGAVRPDVGAAWVGVEAPQVPEAPRGGRHPADLLLVDGEAEAHGGPLHAESMELVSEVSLLKDSVKHPTWVMSHAMVQHFLFEV